MPEIDLNELKKNNPPAYFRRMLMGTGGRVRVLKEQLAAARNSVERERAQADLDQAEADLAFYRRELKRLSDSRPAT